MAGKNWVLVAKIWLRCEKNKTQDCQSQIQDETYGLRKVYNLFLTNFPMYKYYFYSCEFLIGFWDNC